MGLAPAVNAQTNIYQQLQWPFYDSGNAACTQESIGGGGGNCPTPTTLNGHKLTDNEFKWIQWIAQNVVPVLPKASDISDPAALAARVTWWSLKEGDLDVTTPENPIGYSNCGEKNGVRVPNYNAPFLYPCSINDWQLGIAAVHMNEHGYQEPNNAKKVEDQAHIFHEGVSTNDIIGQVATLAGHPSGTPEYGGAINSHDAPGNGGSKLRTSLLLRDPPTGFYFSDKDVLSECLNPTSPPNYCFGQNYDQAQWFAPTKDAALKVIKELTAYFSCPAAGPITSSQSVYMVGDSLTIGIRDKGDSLQKLAAKSWQVSKIDGIDGATVGSAIPKLKSDSAAVTKADAIIIALGTNPYYDTPEATFVKDIKSLINAIKDLNQNAKIYWVNAYGPSHPYDGVNAALDNQAGPLGYQVIDWRTEAKANSSQYPFGSDAIHHTVPGYQAKADFVVSSIGSGSRGEQTTTAAEALAKQNGLDQKWRDLILKYANQFGTDPIAMASILFWENRGFPAYADNYSADPDDSDNMGRGPWQFTRDSWASADGTYPEDAYKADASTKAAAQYLKGYGAVAGIPAGWIDQDFSEGKNIASVATVMKNYNAGGATYRAPGVAKHLAPGRIWHRGSLGDWANVSPSKPKIIDDHIVAGVYLYYQIGSGQKITYKDTDSYVQEALSKEDQIKGYVFGGSVGTVGTTPSGSCITNSCPPGQACGAVSGSIVQTALNYAWPEPPNEAKPPRDPHIPTDAYAKAVIADGAANGGEDCGIFVAVVMHTSGADKNYPDVGTGEQEKYVRTSGKYDVIETVNDVSELKAGDILIVNSGDGANGNGHTYIFVGKQSGGYDEASASQDDRMPSLGLAETHDRRGNYLVARLKQ